MSEFRVVTGCNINVQRAVASVYMKNDLAERDIKKEISGLAWWCSVLSNCSLHTLGNELAFAYMLKYACFMVFLSWLSTREKFITSIIRANQSFYQLFKIIKMWYKQIIGNCSAI